MPQISSKDFLYSDLTYKLRGIAFKIFNSLGPGFREETYKQAFLIELKKEVIPFDSEKAINIYYDGKLIDTYRLDLVIDQKVIIELKAVDELHPRFEAQLLSYLKASSLQLGLLINFGSEEIEIIRRIN